MFRRILCPIDLSKESDEALNYAIAFAKAYSAKLLVVHCVEGQPLEACAYQASLERHVERFVLTRFYGAPSPDWEAIAVEGDPVTAISGEAANRCADLIVMASRRRPNAAALLGSTAEAVCRTAPCPVMVTHPERQSGQTAASGAQARIPFKRVLIAHDFSDCSELALINGVSLAREFHAEVHLLHLLQPQRGRDNYEGTPSPESAFQDATRRLKNSIPAEARLWGEVKVAVREGAPYREILAYADEQEIDLICMGVRGSGFGMKALFGSNADRVIRQANCPVLAARPLRPAIARLCSGNSLA